MTTPTGTVADAMVRHPKLCGADATAADLRAVFTDDHVHAALVVDGDRLLSVVTRSDLATDLPGDAPGRELGRLDGRTIDGQVSAADALTRMRAAHVRRLAVVDDDLRLQGLLCLKRSGLGFCSDADVEARAAERGHC